MEKWFHIYDSMAMIAFAAHRRKNARFQIDYQFIRFKFDFMHGAESEYT